MGTRTKENHERSNDRAGKQPRIAGALEPRKQYTGLAPQSIIQMQRVYGNRMTGMLIQRQLDSRKVSSPGTDSGIIQRKVGFEFETGNIILGASAKEQVMENEQFRIDADTATTKDNNTGNGLEFVIKPSENVEEALAKVTSAKNEAFRMSNKKNKTNNRYTANGEEWKGKYQVYVHDDTWEATVQHTEGVKLQDMKKYLKRNYSLANKETELLGQTNVDGAEQKINDAKVAGLIRLIVLYLETFGAWNGSKADEGPKNALVTMSRTDFHSMFKSLNENERANFIRWLPSVPEMAGRVMTEKVFTNKYIQWNGEEKKNETNELTISEWFTSITDGYSEQVDEDSKKGRKDAKKSINKKERKDGQQPKEIHYEKDQLSPPEGYRGMEPDYSMGAMGMDGDKVLLETRDHGNDTNQTIDNWEQFVQIIFDYISDDQ